jgi:hypothetical protein
MNDSTILIIGWLALAFLITNVIVSINIVKVLNTKGENVDLRWLRFKAFGYAKRYREITTKESGQPGILYDLFVVSAALFFVCLATGIILAYIIK